RPPGRQPLESQTDLAPTPRPPTGPGWRLLAGGFPAHPRLPLRPRPVLPTLPRPGGLRLRPWRSAHVLRLPPAPARRAPLRGRAGLRTGPGQRRRQGTAARTRPPAGQPGHRRPRLLGPRTNSATPRSQLAILRAVQHQEIRPSSETITPAQQPAVFHRNGPGTACRALPNQADEDA